MKINLECVIPTKTKIADELISKRLIERHIIIARYLKSYKNNKKFDYLGLFAMMNVIRQQNNVTEMSFAIRKHSEENLINVAKCRYKINDTKFEENFHELRYMLIHKIKIEENDEFLIDFQIGGGFEESGCPLEKQQPFVISKLFQNSVNNFPRKLYQTFTDLPIIAFNGSFENCNKELREKICTSNYFNASLVAANNAFSTNHEGSVFYQNFLNDLLFDSDGFKMHEYLGKVDYVVIDPSYGLMFGGDGWSELGEGLVISGIKK